MRFIIILFLCFIVVNLFIGLARIVRGKDKGSGAVARSLTIRVAASVALFAFILLATLYFSGSN